MMAVTEEEEKEEEEKYLPIKNNKFGTFKVKFKWLLHFIDSKIFYNSLPSSDFM
jgi:hypothetical protein